MIHGVAKKDKNKTLVILANAPWDSGGMGGNSSQQFARTFMSLGYDIAYVEPRGGWLFKTFDQLPDAENIIVINDFPYNTYFKEIFDLLIQRGAHSVCQIVDHWKSFKTTDVFTASYFKPELEEDIIKTADVVFAYNPLNVKRLKSIRPDIHLLRNGVNLQHFNKAQRHVAVSVPRGRITLGVVASFWVPEWIDLEPLLNYAESHPHDTVNIIGNAHAVINGKSCPPNVIVHGMKHWQDIPPYIHQFDIGVVPYNPATTMYTNPTKVLDYLACGKPVVSCANPSITDYPYVYFYTDSDDFEHAVESASSYSIDKAFLTRFLQNHTWEQRVKTILESLATVKRNKKDTKATEDCRVYL